MSNITLAQKPIIEFSQLDRMALEVDNRLSVYNFDQIVVDEENYKAIKSLRAELNKELKEFEDVRKSIKKSLLEPYEEFERAYNLKIAGKYSNAEQSLKVLIDKVETGMKKIKQDEVLEYFEELKAIHELEFLTFEKANIKVGLSDTVKALKANVLNFVESVENDLDLIKTQPEKSRIFIRYKETMDIRGAITSVLREVEQEKAISERMTPQAISIPVPVMPVVEPIITEPEEILTISFKVSGTKKQIISVREFMKERGIKYE